MRLIGSGSTGSVYEATDTLLNRRVAIRKILEVEGAENSESWHEEFKDFAKSLTSLQHPNIPTVFDAGIDDEGPYMISFFAEGIPMMERLEENAQLDQTEVHSMAEQILDALIAIHGTGSTHGMLSPESLLCAQNTRGGYRYLIIDNGLRKLAYFVHGAKTAFPMVTDPALAAPELSEKQDPTPQSDLFMVGQLFYSLLAGGHPYAGLTIDEACENHKNKSLPPLADYVDNLAPGMEEWITSLIDPDPEKRPTSAEAALSSLPELPEPTPEPQTVTAAVNPLTSATTIDPMVASASQVAQINTATQMASAAGNNSNRNLIIGGSIAGIAIIVAIAVIFGGGSNDGEIKVTTAPITAEPEPADEPFEDTQKADRPSAPAEKSSPAASSSNKQTSITLSSKNIAKSNQKEIVALNANAYLDYNIFTGVPLGSTIEAMRKPNSLFSNVQAIGKFGQKAYFTSNFEFRAPRGGQKFVGSCKASTGQRLTPGSGWKVTLRAPHGHNGPLKGTVYFTQWNAEIKLVIKETTSNLQKSQIARSTQDGSGTFSFVIENPTADASYDIELLYNKPVSQAPASIAFDAISLDN
ncbi:serine/threonine-protein kinase [Persicirhabdus sediminis]|uniref:Serine/threonine protein kinase n=1 Tax=Persicirhabdus sediminis TaxID=454144 RepID=A0A8J7SHA4_9BACT|nr:serine/threonine-protein kinase [Persicirhabdus sediminis]MBK1790665.1 serine/threonine protein kinase [Persicirhabdus sediminis]